ncbi:MAG: hypothetical protein M1818_000554 [Claussenomyces sp. TS43310]|nr:MAG: hypothetical protein M1818_000554 [Claussenomyces sp. TS43310]
MAPKKTEAGASKSKTSSGPSYQDMIKDAITTLKDRQGSSRVALKKYVKANNKINVNDAAFDNLFNKALKSGVDKGIFAQPKGPSGGTKLAKKEPKPAAAKPAAAKPAVKATPAKKPAAPKKTTAAKAKAAPKKPTTKAVAPKKSSTKAKAPAAKTAAAPKKPAAKKTSTAAPAVVDSKSVINKTKSGRVTKTKAPATKKAAPKTAAKKSGAPKKAAAVA